MYGVTVVSWRYTLYTRVTSIHYKRYSIKVWVLIDTDMRLVSLVQFGCHFAKLLQMDFSQSPWASLHLDTRKLSSTLITTLSIWFPSLEQLRYQILGKDRQTPTPLWAWSFHFSIPLLHSTVPFHQIKTPITMCVCVCVCVWVWGAGLGYTVWRSWTCWSDSLKRYIHANRK